MPRLLLCCCGTSVTVPETAPSGRLDNSATVGNGKPSSGHEGNTDARKEDATIPAARTQVKEAWTAGHDERLERTRPRMSGEEGNTTGDAHAARLYKACKNGKLEVVRELLETTGEMQSPHLETRGMWNNTPLLCACQNGHAGVALALLQAGASPDAVNERGNSSILFACLEGLDEVVSALLSHRHPGVEGYSDARAQGSSLGQTLVAASHVYCPATDSMELLTPLSAAVIMGHVRIAKQLLRIEQVRAAASSSSTNDTNEINVLRCACISKQEELLSLLLNGSSDEADPAIPIPGLVVDLAAADSWGNTVLHEAVARRCSCTTVRLLLERGAPVDACNAEGVSALLSAIRTDKPEVAQMLVDAGASVSTAFGRQRRTLLMEACSNGSFECASLLVKAGADTSAVDEFGTTALRIAEAEGNDDLVDALRA